MYTRYKIVEKQNQTSYFSTPVFNLVSLVLGLVGCIGMGIVANFQVCPEVFFLFLGMMEYVCVWSREAGTQGACLCQESSQIVDEFVKVGIVCFLETHLYHLKVSPAWCLGEGGVHVCTPMRERVSHDVPDSALPHVTNMI